MHIGLLPGPTYAGGNDVDVIRFTRQVYFEICGYSSSYISPCRANSPNEAALDVPEGARRSPVDLDQPRRLEDPVHPP